MSPLSSPPSSRRQAEKNPFESLKTQTLSPQEYRVIADQNLFHPDRIIPPEKKPESVLPKPEFILFGTLITPDLRMAYLEDKKAPVTTPGRGQRQTALKIGESLSGFRLKEVMTDKVVMTRGEETIQVLLQEPGSSKARETTSCRGPELLSQPPVCPLQVLQRSYRSFIPSAGNDSCRLRILLFPSLQGYPLRLPAKGLFLPVGCADFPPRGFRQCNPSPLVLKDVNFLNRLD